MSINGQSGTFNGTVTRVGPVDSGSSGYTYPLVVALTPGSFSPSTTVAGSTAQVAVDIAQASHTVVVPTSAVHTTSAGSAYVMTLKSGHEARTTVKVGVVGDIYTQITSGLSAGTPSCSPTRPRPCRHRAATPPAPSEAWAGPEGSRPASRPALPARASARPGDAGRSVEWSIV